MNFNKTKSVAIERPIGEASKVFLIGDLGKSLIPAFVGWGMVYNPVLSYIKIAYYLLFVLLLLSLVINKNPLGDIRKNVLNIVRVASLIFLLISVSFTLTWLFFHSSELTLNYILLFTSNFALQLTVYELLSQLSEKSKANEGIKFSDNTKLIVITTLLFIANLVFQVI